MSEPLSPTKQALLAIQKLQGKLASLERERTEPIAIVGMAMRFPGGVNDAESYWRLLENGVDAISEVPKDRWDAEALFDEDPGAPGKSYSKWGGFLSEDVSCFDANFFGLSRRETVAMDPQQRMLLEVSYDALLNAGHPLDRPEGSNTGVFVGLSVVDYAWIMGSDLRGLESYTGTGVSYSVAAGRLSFQYDFQGPSMTVDTACSSSLLAVHLACQSLRNRECRYALAGGINLMLSPVPYVVFSKGRFLAADGRCKTFDSRADGYTRGEGCGFVVLKRLSDAQADGDKILAVIRGSAVNQDGRTAGLTAPSVAMQQKLLKQALESARLGADQVGYIEAHGTGTALGDPIEVEALKAVYAQPCTQQQPLYLGSIKTNFGHLEAAAGIAGLIKVVLSLQHGKIPQHLHFQQLNPNISFEATPFRIPTSTVPWPAIEGPRVAGVSSFGFSGTNAHVLLEEAPPAPVPEAHPRSEWLLPLSAKNPDALRDLAREYRAALSQPNRLSDICYTASRRRPHLEHRLSVVGDSAESLADRLGIFMEDGPRTGITQGQKLGKLPKLAFVCSGQGPQWHAMGRQLLDRNADFRQAFEAIDALFKPLAGWSLVSELKRDEASSRMQETEVAQPCLFALQVGLAAVWRAWGIVPDAIVGHSVGEVAAAHLSGMLTLEEAVHVVLHRGRVMQRASEHGKMAAVSLSEEAATAQLAGYEGRVGIAAVNEPRSVTLSGDAAAMDEVLIKLQAQQIACRELKVRYAFHSHHLAPLQPDLKERLKRVAPRPASTLLLSTLTGKQATSSDYDAAYWSQQMRAPVAFYPAIQQLIDRGFDLFLELSPHPVLSHSLGEIMRAAGKVPAAIPTLRRGEDEPQSLLGALGGLYAFGYPIDWAKLYPAGAHVELPGYPWQRERFWLEHTVLERVVEVSAAAEAPPLRRERDRLMEVEGAERIERLKEYLRGRVARALAIPAAQVKMSSPLIALGIDSIMATELKTWLQKDLDLSVSVVLFLDGSCVTDLAGQLMAMLAGQTAGVRTLDWNLEAALAADIVCEAQGPATGSGVFLTGATGFLGAYLLRDLLEGTTAPVHCLVRAESPEQGLARIRSHLQSHGIWQDGMEGRIVPELGDLGRPRMGLSDERFAALAASIERVYHSGAHVNHMFPYAALKAANATGTQEVLRLAATHHAKPVHFVSTNALFMEASRTSAEIVRPDDVPDSPAGLPNGYLQSKWVAEQLVLAARSRGIPATVYRPGFISGATGTGVSNLEDAVSRIFKGCIELGSVPDVPGATYDMVPVDVVSHAIIQLSLLPEAQNQSFLITHPTPATINGMFDAIRALGYPLERLAFDDWRAELVRRGSSPDSSLFSLVPLYSERGPDEARTLYERSLLGELPQFDSTSTWERLRGTLECAPIGPEEIGAYIGYFERCGFVPRRPALHQD